MAQDFLALLFVAVFPCLRANLAGPVSQNGVHFIHLRNARTIIKRLHSNQPPTRPAYRESITILRECSTAQRSSVAAIIMLMKGGPLSTRYAGHSRIFFGPPYAQAAFHASCAIPRSLGLGNIGRADTVLL